MDPATAIANAAAGAFNFLCSPQGQLIVADLRQLNSTIAKDIGTLVNFIAGKVK